MGSKPRCDFSQNCFAKEKVTVCGFEILKCKILTGTFFGGEDCPFAKPVREITKGKRYPFNPREYSEKLEYANAQQLEEVKCDS